MNQDMLKWARTIDDSYQRDYERAKKERDEWRLKLQSIVDGNPSEAVQAQYEYWLKVSHSRESVRSRCPEEGPWHPNKTSLRQCRLPAGHDGEHDNGSPHWKWKVIDGKHCYTNPQIGV